MRPEPDIVEPPARFPEWLDGGGLTAHEVGRAIADLDRFYRVLGRGVVHRTVRRWIGGGAPERWLDVGAGGGALGRDLERLAARRGRRLGVVRLDRRLAHLVAGAGPRQGCVVADAERLPFADGSFEVVTSHLLFHHFDPGTNRRVLREMRRAARRAVIVIDLARSPLLRACAPLALRLLRLGAVAYHDGIVSVARAYRRRDVAELVAGEPVLELRGRFPVRFSLVLAGGDATPPPPER